jgi:signal transduction histidine kinase
VTPPDPDKLFKLLDSIGEMLEAHDPVGGAASPGGGDSRQDATNQPRRLADMRLLMCRASAELREYAAEHGCHVRLQLPADPLLVQATASHLEIALVNLLRNAIDAHATTVTLLAELEDNRVEVRVDDDGTPCEVDSASALLETPQRWSAHMAGRIARTIAEDHGGQLVLHAYPGRGASACLSLPQAQPVAKS